MKTIDVLKTARATLEDPARWTRGWFFRDDKGAKVANPADASCFCMLGACIAAAGNSVVTNIPGELALRYVLDGLYPADFNDDPTTTHADILRVFDDAISKLDE